MEELPFTGGALQALDRPAHTIPDRDKSSDAVSRQVDHRSRHVPELSHSVWQHKRGPARRQNVGEMGGPPDRGWSPRTLVPVRLRSPEAAEIMLAQYIQMADAVA